ncbi:prenyltransferase, partial [bacterium]|nr:prenyltransferase [bacterium]
MLFYTYPLKYIGLGEIAVLAVWGPLMVGGGYYVLAGHWSWNVVLASLPYALGTTTVLFGKHIDKLGGDARKNIFTLPVLLGERTARYAVIAMAALQYILVFALIASGFFSPLMLLVLLALHPFLSGCGYRQPRPDEMPARYRADIWPLWFVAVALLAQSHLRAAFCAGPAARYRPAEPALMRPPALEPRQTRDHQDKHQHSHQHYHP